MSGNTEVMASCLQLQQMGGMKEFDTEEMQTQGGMTRRSLVTL